MIGAEESKYEIYVLLRGLNVQMQDNGGFVILLMKIEV